MSFHTKIAVVMSVATLFIVFGSMAVAEDDASWKSMVNFTESVQIGSLVFAPGSYSIERISSPADRYIMSVYSIERKQWEGIVMGVPAHRVDTSKVLDLTFTKQAHAEPQLLEYWFHQHSLDGIKFLSQTMHVNRVVQTASN
jgi:hypothetical protein